MTGHSDIGSRKGLKVPCPLHDSWANAKSCRDTSRLFKDYSLLIVRWSGFCITHFLITYAIPLVVSLCLCGPSPPISWFYGLAKGHVGLWSCGMCVCYACLCMYNCHGVPSSPQIHCPELALYFECWSPHPQTMDTELLSQRLDEYHYCLPEHMHGHAASAHRWICCQHSD